MLKRSIVLSAALSIMLGCGTGGSIAESKMASEKPIRFKVLIENITDRDGVAERYGSKNLLGLSPGVYTIGREGTTLFKDGEHASAAIEAMAEDGRIDLFKGISGEFSVPVGMNKPAPIFGGASYAFEFVATKGAKLNLVTMYGPSNDLFYAPRRAIALFDSNGKPITGDITGKFLLWDAGTEVNQPPGTGPDQAPLQKAQNTGADEHGVVHLVNDGFTYPTTKSVMRVTISVE